MRIAKQIAIAIIFLLFLGGIGFLVYQLFPHAPVASCVDGIQNQNEEGVDCGGSCSVACANPQELTLFQAKIIPTKEGFVDVFAELKNDNLTLGVPLLRYTFELYDEAETLITSKSGVTYILPNDTKYIVENAVSVRQIPKRVKFIFQAPQFEEIKNYIKPRLVALNTVSDDELGFVRVRGSLANQTNHSYHNVNLIVLLRDDVKRVVAVSQQEVTTLISNENRFFDLRWPYQTPFFSQVETRVETNIFDEANVIRFVP